MSTARSANPGPIAMPVGNGVSVIDTLYTRARHAASHLIIEDGRAAFVDTGAGPATPRLLAALAECGLQADQVEYVFLTHVHLDHAGGAGRLMQALPKAKAVVHPRGAPHLVDPTRLIAGTIAVYGEATFRDLYEDVLPIHPDRLIVPGDGERLFMGQRRFEFIDTPGHARHHHSIVDPDHREIYTGDAFGLCYHEFDTHKGAFIIPTTTPVQFDPQAMHASVDRLLTHAPLRVFQTHFGPVKGVLRLASDLHRLIDEFVEIALHHKNAPDRTARISQSLYACLDQRLDAHGYEGDADQRHALLDEDIDLNTAGLEVWLDRN